MTDNIDDKISKRENDLLINEIKYYYSNLVSKGVPYYAIGATLITYLFNCQKLNSTQLLLLIALENLPLIPTKFVIDGVRDSSLNSITYDEEMISKLKSEKESSQLKLTLK